MSQSDSTGTSALTGMSIVIHDDFTSWELYGEDEAAIGTLKLRWFYQGDWTEWEYRIGDMTGYIKLRNKNDPNIWELRSGNEIITLKTIYNGDFNQWRITNDSYTLTFRTTYENVYDGWKVVNSKNGSFDVYTEWEMDPRDWIVHDRLKSPATISYKIAMVFIASFYSSPKY